MSSLQRETYSKEDITKKKVGFFFFMNIGIATKFKVVKFRVIRSQSIG